MSTVLKKIKGATEISITKDNRYIISCGNKINIYNNSGDYEIVSTIQNFKNPTTFDISDDINYLVCKNTSGNLAVFDLKNIKNISSINTGFTEGPFVKFDKNNNIISGDWDGNIFSLTNTNDIRLLYSNANCNLRGIEYIKDIDTFVFLLYKGGTNNSDPYHFIIKWKNPLYSSNKNELIKMDFEICDVKYNSIYNCFALLTIDSIKIYNYEFNECLYEHKLGENISRIGSFLDWSDNGMYISFVTSYPSHYCKVFKYKEFELVYKLNLKYYALYCGLSHDSKKLLVCNSYDGYIIDFEDLANKPEPIIEDITDLSERKVSRKRKTKKPLMDINYDELFEASQNKISNSDDLFNDSMPIAMKIVYLTGAFVQELDEGGFIQFFTNYDKSIRDLLEDYLSVINSKHIINIYNKARTDFESIEKGLIIDENTDIDIEFKNFNEKIYYSEYDICNESIESLVTQYFKDNDLGFAF